MRKRSYIIQHVVKIENYILVQRKKGRKAWIFYILTWEKERILHAKGTSH